MIPLRLQLILWRLRLPFLNRQLRDRGPETLNESELEAWHRWWTTRGEAGLRTLLLEQWDPIGIGDVPECVDEYNDYIPRLAGILRRGGHTEDVARYLTEIETEWMEIDTEPRELLGVASEICDWHQKETERRPRRNAR